MNTQPHERSEVEALRMAELFEAADNTTPGGNEGWLLVAAELRRLHALNAQLTQISEELLEVLKYIVDVWVEGNGSEWNQSDSAAKARAAIAKAESTLKTE